MPSLLGGGPKVRRVFFVVLREGVFFVHLVGFRSHDTHGNVPNDDVPLRHEDGAKVGVHFAFNGRACFGEATTKGRLSVFIFLLRHVGMHFNLQDRI